MLHFLPGPLLGLINISLFIINLALCAPILFIAALLRFLLPLPQIHRGLTWFMHVMPEFWVNNNRLILALTLRLNWQTSGIENLNAKEWYLLLSNHQSWLDIIVLQIAFNRKIPMLKFFLKKELIWVPFVGLACKVLDFPFMQRHSKEYIAKHPEAKYQDLENTRHACEKFKAHPISVINFVEGTRFTPAKHQAKKSPYQYLLPPRAGGVAFVLGAMGNTLHKLLNVTLSYPPKRGYNLWQFFCGKVNNIRIDVTVNNIDDNILGDYLDDETFRLHFQRWLNELWAEKDQQLKKIYD